MNSVSDTGTGPYHRESDPTTEAILFMLHETAVAWLRIRLAKTLPRNCWSESVAAYHQRLKAACAYTNENYDVEGLCKDLPHRVQMLLETKGDRIGK